MLCPLPLPPLHSHPIKRLARSAPNDVAQFKIARGARWVEALTLLPGELTEGGGASKSIFRIRVTQPGPDYQDPFLPIVLRRQSESAAGISSVGRIRQPHFALWHTRRWNEFAQLGFSPHPNDWRLRDRYRSSRRRKDNSRSVSRLDDSQ